MSAAVLATDEEWSIISSSDLEELSGSASDVGHDSEFVVPSLDEHGVESGFLDSGMQKCVDGISNSSAIMDPTIASRETFKVNHEGSQNSQTLQETKTPSDQTKIENCLCGYARSCSSVIGAGWNRWEDLLFMKSRAMFQGLVGVYLANLKRRAGSTASRSFLEKVALNSLLRLEEEQDYLIAYVLSFYALYYATYVIISVVADRYSSVSQLPESFISQQINQLRQMALGPDTRTSPKSSKILGHPKVKDLCLQVATFFHWKSAAAKCHSPPSSWHAKLWTLFPKHQPPAQQARKWLNIDWDEVKQEIVGLKTTWGFADKLHPHLLKLQSSAYEMFHSCRSSDKLHSPLLKLQSSAYEVFHFCRASVKQDSLDRMVVLCRSFLNKNGIDKMVSSYHSSFSAAAKALSQKAREEQSKMSGLAKPYVQVLQKHLQTFWAQSPEWIQQAAAFTQTSMQQYFKCISNYFGSEAWKGSVFAQHFGRVHSQLDAIAVHSYLTMQRWCAFFVKSEWSMDSFRRMMQRTLTASSETVNASVLALLGE